MKSNPEAYKWFGDMSKKFMYQVMLCGDAKKISPEESGRIIENSSMSVVKKKYDQKTLDANLDYCSNMAKKLPAGS